MAILTIRFMIKINLCLEMKGHTKRVYINACNQQNKNMAHPDINKPYIAKPISLTNPPLLNLNCARAGVRNTATNTKNKKETKANFKYFLFIRHMVLW